MGRANWLKLQQEYSPPPTELVPLMFKQGKCVQIVWKRKSLRSIFPKLFSCHYFKLAAISEEQKIHPYGKDPYSLTKTVEGET